MTKPIRQIDIDFVNAYKEIRSTIIPITGKAQFSRSEKKITSYRSVADLYSVIPDILIKHNILMEVNLIERIFPRELYEMVSTDGEVVSTVQFRRKYIGKFEGIFTSTIDFSEKKKFFEDVIDVLDPSEFGYSKALSCVTKDFLLNVFSIPSSDNSVERAPQVKGEVNNAVNERKIELIKELKNRIQNVVEVENLQNLSEKFFEQINHYKIKLSDEEFVDCNTLYSAKLKELNKKIVA